eukprot:s966_g23.t2
MNKLQKDLTDGRLQWDAYVADLKTALKTQKARFLQEQERITKELHHTKELREQAYRQLKPFNAGGSDTGPTAMELSQDIEEWNEIARELDAPPDGKADGPLLKLMQALQQAGVSMESTMPAVPATPPRRETQVPPATPPHATKTLAQARSPLSGGGTPTGDEALKDPYLSSPGLAHFGVHSASAGPVAGAMPAAPAASNVEAQRGENASEMLRMLAREPPPGLRNASPRNVEQRGVWKRKQTARELFADRTGWDPPHEVPTMCPAQGLLVMHGEERFFMPSRHHTGQTPKEAICSVFDYEGDECTLGAFRTPNLEIRGNPCTHVVLVSPLPNPRLRGQPHCNRRDIFVLCDFRGIGYNVRVYHSFVHTVHLPSLAALFDYSIPQGQRLAAVGKRPGDDDVPVQAQETLVLYATPLPTGSQQVCRGERTPPEPDPPGDSEGTSDHAPSTGYSVACPDTKTRQLQRRSGPYGKPTSQTVSTVPQPLLLLQPFAASVWGCGCGRPRDLGIQKDRLTVDFDQGELFRDTLSLVTAFSDALGVPHLTRGFAGSPPAPLINQFKLDQEPYSRTPAARAALEVARDHQLEQGRPWPTLLADDEHAIANAACETSTDEGSGDGVVFTVGILIIEHDIESVQVRLEAPATIADLLGQLTLRRDQDKGRVHAVRGEQGYGLTEL